MGLGNPGEHYRETRHNVGFHVVETLARRRGVRRFAEECGALVATLPGPQGEVLLAMPQTYMNRSGHAAHCLSERYALVADGILVVYDEIHLPLGRLRLRRGGSPGGHRGLESIVESLRTDQVPRLRLGLAGESGPPPGGESLVEFVLSPFDAAEREPVLAMIERAADACEAWLERGIEAAMQGFNH